MKKHISFILYTILYGGLSLTTLSTFPLVHSDEAWLAGLTHSMMAKGSVFTTESFFDLMPRTPHLIKVFYHGLQMPLISLFGYTIFSVRILSFIALLATIIILYLWLDQNNEKKILNLLILIFITSHIQIIYASHFARQEMVLITLLMLCIFLYQEDNNKVLGLGLTLGLSIGIHPNSFIIAAMVGILILKDTLIKKLSLKRLIHFILTIGFFALIFAGISLIMNPNFISEYFQYGQTLGVDAGPVSRLMNFRDFYLKVFYQITGTYYIPNINYILIIGYSLVLLHIAIIPFTLIIRRSYKKDIINYLSSWPFNLALMTVAFNIALFIIGRYNTTSIVFLVFILLLLTGQSLVSLKDYLPKKEISFLKLSLSLPSSLISLILIFFILLNIKVVYEDYQAIAGSDYNRYQDQLRTAIPENAIILGNLSSGFVFKDQVFYDIRNIAFLGDQSISDYIKDRGINTIIYYEEYDYIHRNPMWTILYGDDDYYYELNQFLQKNTTLKASFEDAFYGSRIIRYMGDYPWKIFIYEVIHE